MNELARLLVLLIISVNVGKAAAQENTAAQENWAAQNGTVPAASLASNQAIRDAFLSAHDGWSVDELLVQDSLRNRFLDIFETQSDSPLSVEQKKWLLQRLIQIRKSGKLDVQSTKRSRIDSTKWTPVAEIASRQMMDRFQTNVDQWLVDPELLAHFDAAAKTIEPEIDPEDIRRSALRLRKSRRLQPELMSRVVDWKREIAFMSVEDAAANLDQLPKNAGIYIFRDKTGFLYIGQSNNLRSRLTKHLDQSDRKSLCEYLRANSQDQITLELHVFAVDSPASETTAREAYESDLIRTRHPRFNVAP